MVHFGNRSLKDQFIGRYLVVLLSGNRNHSSVVQLVRPSMFSNGGIGNLNTEIVSSRRGVCVNNLRLLSRFKFAFAYANVI